MSAYMHNGHTAVELTLGSATKVSKEVGAAAPAYLRAVAFLQSKTLFCFSNALVRPDALTSLVVFVGELCSLSDGAMTSIGHTTPVDSNASNQRLSAQRLAAVCSYFGGVGMGAARTNSEGYDEKSPAHSAMLCGVESNSLVFKFKILRLIYLPLLNRKVLVI